MSKTSSLLLLLTSFPLVGFKVCNTTEVGKPEGMTEGKQVGKRVGTVEGLFVGLQDGDFEGELGLAVCQFTGTFDGDLATGDLVGFFVGLEVGNTTLALPSSSMYVKGL